MEKDDETEIELRKLQEIAQLSSVYYRNLKNFEKNPNLSHVVQAVMNSAQSVCIIFIEIFHIVHHVINDKQKEQDPNVPDLPEERNPIFFVYPVCMIISLTLTILWLTKPKFRLLIDMTLAGCAVGIVMMIAAGIVEMRHCEIYIDLQLVSDEDLSDHPVFVHNFFLCIISIVTMVFYLIQFWLAYDCWQWRRKSRDREGTTEESRSNSQAQEQPVQFPIAQTSTNDEYESTSNLDRIPPWDLLPKKMLNVDETNLEDEPVTLYCCFVDCWRYVRNRHDRKPIHEFQVVHVK